MLRFVQSHSTFGLRLPTSSMRLLPGEHAQGIQQIWSHPHLVKDEIKPNCVVSGTTVANVLAQLPNSKITVFNQSRMKEVPALGCLSSTTLSKMPKWG